VCSKGLELSERQTSGVHPAKRGKPRGFKRSLFSPWWKHVCIWRSLCELGREIMNQPNKSEAENAQSELPKAGRFRVRSRTAALVAVFLVAVLSSASSVYSTHAATTNVAQRVAQEYYPYSGCYYGPYEASYSAVLCYGYIYQAPNGCALLVVWVANVAYYGGTALQYYTLHNLSSSPPTGTWVRVEGQMYKGYNTSPNGFACPGNYINVTNITKL